MLKLAILSLFRTSMWYLDTYIRQVRALEWPGEKRVYAVEGDHADGTRDALLEWAQMDDVKVITHNHGYRIFGSTQNPIRLRELAKCGNAGLDAIAYDKWADVVWFVDSDYRIAPDVAMRLRAHGKEAIAAYPMAESMNRGKFFYDTWGWSWKGRPFRQWGPPYHPAIRGNAIHPVDTVGGNLMLDAALVYDGARMSEAEPIRGLCKAVRERGVGLWGDPQTMIWHLYPWTAQ